MWERIPLPATTRRANQVLRDIERCLTLSLARGTLPRNQLELVPRLIARREARVAEPRSLPSLENIPMHPENPSNT